MAKHETKILTLANSKKEDKLGLPEVEFLARARSFKSRYLTLTEADTLFCYCSVYRYSNRYFLSALFEYIEPQPKFPNTRVHFANSNITLCVTTITSPTLSAAFLTSRTRHAHQLRFMVPFIYIGGF